MTAKAKAKNRILEAVHETAGDLHRLGFIDKRKMQKYDVLCLTPVQDYAPNEVSSAVQAIDKALAKLMHAREGEVIAHADHVAEIAAGPLEDRVHRMRTLRQVFTEGDWLTSEQLNSLQDVAPMRKSQPASDWKRRGCIFSVSRGGREYFARYQFDAMYAPLPVIHEILEAFGDAADPWTLAAWFHYPNAWIAGADSAPMAPKDALDRREDVVQAALKRRTSYIT